GERMAMLYSCHPPAGRSAAVKKRTARRTTTQRLNVDIHCHVYVPEADEVVGDAAQTNWDAMHTYSSEATREVNRKQMQSIYEQLTSVDRRLSDMDATGIDVQALSPAPPQYYYGLEPD